MTQIWPGQKNNTMFGNSKISFASGGKEAKSLASLSIEKVYKPTYFDKIGNAHT